MAVSTLPRVRERDQAPVARGRERTENNVSERDRAPVARGRERTENNVERPALAWPYVAILLAEITVLVTLAIQVRPHPPLTYELGWAGVGSMIVMQVYSLRRRVRALQNLGSLRGWLDMHVFLGLQGFVLVAYHSIGITVNANLAAVNFGLVALVVITGLTGRYLYSFIPRTRAELVGRCMSLPPRLRRECRGFWDLIGLDLARRKLLRELSRDPSLSRERLRSLRNSITVASRVSMLEVADRWFARWTLLHRPLSVLLLGITVLHVLAHFAYAT